MVYIFFTLCCFDTFVDIFAVQSIDISLIYSGMISNFKLPYTIFNVVDFLEVITFQPKERILLMFRSGTSTLIYDNFLINKFKKNIMHECTEVNSTKLYTIRLTHS